MPVVGTDFQFKLHRQGVILDPFRAKELLVRQSENTLAWNKRVIHWRQMGTLFLKWYHSLPKSLPGKEKGNWIKNTSFLKFEVCFEVEDHHGTDNTINISVGEAGSWVSRCFKCWLLFTSAMLPTLVPRCPQSCWYTSWLVKKRVKRHPSDKACKTQTDMMQKKKRWGPKPSNFQKFRKSFWYSYLFSQVTSGPKAQPQVSVVGWHLTSWKVMIKIQVNSAVEGKKFLDWLDFCFNSINVWLF